MPRRAEKKITNPTNRAFTLLFFDKNITRPVPREANGDEPAADLANATDADLLRRLNLVKGSRELTNAGSLLFVATPWPGVDYIRRDMPGGDSTLRIEGAGPLLMQVREVEQAGKVANRVTHTAEGFAHGRIRAIPPRTLREAIVNGFVHRDWVTPRPTVIEHVGDTLTVTSPGGFLGGVTPDNIITHPAVPRYRNLSEAMAALGLAEREGIGVDRMVRDMLAIGRSAPVIAEIDGPYVRVVLLGGAPDSAGSAAVIARVQGIPPHQPDAFRLSDTVRGRLAHRLASLRAPEGREALILDWSGARGRVSTTEVADLTGLSKVSAGRLLTGLADAGHLKGGRPTRKGRGFFYVPVEPGE